jgi:hypothetical protein
LRAGAGPILLEPPRPESGKVTGRGPGLGLDWDEAAIAPLQDGKRL